MNNRFSLGTKSYYLKGKRKKIGQGGFGKVYKDTLVRDDGIEEIVAIKELHKESKIDEAKVLQELRHRNIILCYDVYKENINDTSPKQVTHLILEFADHGDLQSLLRKDEHPGCDELYEWTIDIARGMNYFHNDLPQYTRIHCDLKTANILIANGPNRRVAKIADFGLSLKSNRPSSLIRNHLGTYHYMAPEVCCNPETWSKKADVWSYGIIIWEILMECTPYPDNGGSRNPIGVFYHIGHTSQPPKLQDDFPEFFLELIRTCCKQSCDERPDIQDVLNSFPYSNDVTTKETIIADLTRYKKILWSKPRPQADPDWFFAPDSTDLQPAAPRLLPHKFDIVDDGIKQKLAEKIATIQLTEKMISICKDNLEGDIPTSELELIKDAPSLAELLKNYDYLSLENLDDIKALFAMLEIEDPKLQYLIDRTLEIIPSTLVGFENLAACEPMAAGQDQLSQIQVAFTNEKEEDVEIQDEIFCQLSVEFNYLGDNLSNYWLKFARHLGVSQAAIENIEEQSSNQSTYDSVMKCFRFWTENLIQKNKDLSKFNLQILLIKALNDSGLQCLAKGLNDLIHD